MSGFHINKHQHYHHKTSSIVLTINYYYCYCYLIIIVVIIIVVVVVDDDTYYYRNTPKHYSLRVNSGSLWKIKWIGWWWWYSGCMIACLDAIIKFKNMQSLLAQTSNSLVILGYCTWINSNEVKLYPTSTK